MTSPVPRSARHRCVAILLVVVGIAATAPAHADPPPLEALAPRWDAGRVEAGTEIRHTYELRNTGPRPLQISAKPSCGCTTADYDKEIPPNGVGKLTAVLDTTHARGRVEKVVTVTTNDPMQPAITLTILGEIVRALVVEPGDQPSVHGPFHSLRPVDLTVRAPDDAPFVITSVDDDAMLRATVAPVEDETAAGANGHRRYRVTLTPRADLEVGIHHTTITLHTTAPRAESFALPSTIVVAGPLVALPPEFRLSAALPPSASVRITAADGSTFRVLETSSPDLDLVAEAVPVPNEPAWDVTVRYVGPATRHGQLNSVLRVDTDEPAQRRLVLRISGKL